MKQVQSGASLPPSPRLQTLLLDSLGEAAIATDLNGIIIYWNRFATDLYGYAAEEVIGRSIFDVTVASVAEATSRDIFDHVSAGLPWRGEIQVRRKDGGTFFAEVKNVPLTGEDGRIFAVIGLSHDITGRREEEAKREALIAKLERASRAKDDFLALVSHELRTPVTTILGFAELITRDGSNFDSEAVDGALLDIRDGARRLNRIVTDLLTLSRLEATNTVEVEPVSIVRLLVSLVEDRGHLFSNRGVTLEVGEDVPPVLANEAYLEHVLINLLTNAAKYSPASESIEVEVRAERGAVSILVKDRGIGIKDDEIDHIFDAFYRSPRIEHLQGAGMGLSVCRRLMDAQKGAISVEQRPEGGTIFVLTLPVASEL